jgi:two-component system phosphate regulon sensor histidine kinase PhoR
LNYLNEKIGESSLELPIENYISQIMEVIDFPVVIFDKSGGIKLCNKSFKEIFPGTEKDKYFWETINNFEIIEFIEKAIQKKEKIKFEVQHKNKFYTGISAFLEKAENLLLILYDITNIKLSEESKKNLIVNISHELKTPLSIIKGYIETLEDELKNSEYVNFVEIIRKHTDRLIEILERMLTISEVESEKIEIEEINLEEILRNIYKLFEKKAEEKNLEFVLNFEKVPRIKGDKLKIEQAIINIVDNAFKFTEKGKIEINLKKVNNYIMIEVKDTGPGIPEEEKFKIFERFYTLDKGRSKKGIGIGLSIVRHIINQHNGKIEVESKLNEGSSFKIFLPV